MDRQDQSKPVSNEDFSGKNIEKFVLKQAISHPITWLPLGVAALAGVAGVGATSLEAMAGAMVLALVGVCHGAFKYFFQGENIAKKRVEELRAQIERQKQIQLHGLLQEFSGHEFNEGIEIVNRLVSIYKQLSKYLREKIDRDKNPSAIRFLSLADNTYEQGLRVAKQALNLHSALRKMDPVKLERELKKAQKQLDALSEEDGTKNGEAQSLSRKVKSCQNRLDSYHKYEDRLLKMIEQGEQMVEALENANVDVAMLVEKTDLSFAESDAAKTLERHIRAAQKVDDMIFGSEEQDEEDEVYREAGQQTANNSRPEQTRERS